MPTKITGHDSLQKETLVATNQRQGAVWGPQESDRSHEEICPPLTNRKMPPIRLTTRLLE